MVGMGEQAEADHEIKAAVREGEVLQIAADEPALARVFPRKGPYLEICLWAAAEDR